MARERHIIGIGEAAKTSGAKQLDSVGDMLEKTEQDLHVSLLGRGLVEDESKFALRNKRGYNI